MIDGSFCSCGICKARLPCNGVSEHNNNLLNGTGLACRGQVLLECTDSGLELLWSWQLSSFLVFENVHSTALQLYSAIHVLVLNQQY